MKKTAGNLKSILRQFVVFTLIIALTLPMITAFAQESEWDEFVWEELPEIEPLGFDPTMMSRLGGVEALNAADVFDTFSADFPILEDQVVDLSGFVPIVNELTEPSAEALEGYYTDYFPLTPTLQVPMLPIQELVTDPSSQSSHENASAFDSDIRQDQMLSEISEELYDLDLETMGIDTLSAPHENIVENPFTLRFNANDAVRLNTGAALYHINILNLPGRNGFDFNLDMLYDSSRADMRCIWMGAYSLHGLGVGWKLDLPYRRGNTIYIPGRGQFQTWINRQLHDIIFHHGDTSFTSGDLRSNLMVTVYDGTSYFFSGAHIIGQVDRFGNTIRFEYENIPNLGNALMLARVVDTNGQIIAFSYQETGNNRRVTVTAPDQSAFVINMSRIQGHSLISTGLQSDFQIESVTNQVGATTFFSNELVTFYSVENRHQWFEHRFNSYSVLLRQVTYPSGAILRYDFRRQSIRILPRVERQVHRVSSVVLLSGGRAYQRLDFVFQDVPYDPQSWVRDVLRRATVTQNNGLSMVYSFNNYGLNTAQRQYNAAGALLSNVSISYQNRYGLPTRIVRNEHRDGFTRTTTQEFTYNNRGQVIQAISPMAQGSTHERYRINYTLDSRFGLPLTRTSWPDAQTTVLERNTLSPDGRRVVRTDVYENNVRRTRTDFLHDTFGNVTEIRQFPNVNTASFIATQITFDSGTMPSAIRTTGVRDAGGAMLGGNGIVESRFTYDQMWRVLSETDPNGYVTQWQYDGMGRVTRVTFPNGGFETFTYNDTQNILTHRTVLGAVYTHQFDRLGNLLTITAPGGTVIRRNTFDNRMRLIETQNAQGVSSSYRMTFVYDIFDRVVETRRMRPDGVAVELEEVHFNDVFNASGDSRIQIITHSGNASAPNIHSFSHYDRFGRRIQEGVIGGRLIAYTHDLSGRVTREQSLGIDNTFTYNIFGVESVRNIEGRTSTSTYDGMGRLVTVSDFAGNIQRFTYDELGRLISHRTPFERVGNAIQYAETRYFYDRGGNLIRTSTLINSPGTAQRWATTENTFRHNRLVATQIGGTDGIRVEYTYDLAGNILTMSNGGAVTTYSYNNRGQLTQIRDALGQVESFTYDANGLLLTRTDRNGTRFNLMYTARGLLHQEEAIQNGVAVSRRWWSHNPTRSLNSTGDWTGSNHVIHYFYDAQGRLIRQEEMGGIVKTFAYNEANNVTASRTYINGALHINNTYTFDAAQRMHTARANGALMATYAYDANGNRISTTLGNGTVTEYTFNLANIVTNVTNRRGSTVLSSFAYLHYLDGNVRQITERDRVITYAYDLARRLVREEAFTLGPSAAGMAVNFDVASMLNEERTSIIASTINSDEMLFILENEMAISSEELLTMSENETETSLTVRATSPYTSAVSDHATALNLSPQHKEVITLIPITPCPVGWSGYVPELTVKRQGNTVQLTIHIISSFCPWCCGISWQLPDGFIPDENHYFHVDAYFTLWSTIDMVGMVTTCGLVHASPKFPMRANNIDVTPLAESWISLTFDTTFTVPEQSSVSPIVHRIIVSPDSTIMSNGGTRQFDALLQTIGNPPLTVIWTVVGNTCPRTKISSDGVLTISENETARNLTVRATSTHTPTASGSAGVWISTVTNVTVSAHIARIVARGGTWQFAASVQGAGNPPQIVSWTVEGNTSPDTVISSRGLLAVSVNETAETLTIRATSTHTPTVYGAVTVDVVEKIIREYTFDNRGNRIRMVVSGSENYTVTYTYDLNNRLLTKVRTGGNPQTTTFTYDHNGNQLTSEVVSNAPAVAVTEVNVSPSSAYIRRNSNLQLNAVVYGTNSPPQGVTWSIEGNTSNATNISSSGRLTVAQNEMAGTIFVHARSTHSPSMYGTATMSVLPGIVTDIIVMRNTMIGAAGRSFALRAVIVGENPPAGVIWSVEGNHSSGTDITSDGWLNVAIDETAEYLTVRATSMHFPEVFGTLNVNISSEPCRWCGSEKEYVWDTAVCSGLCCALCGGLLYDVGGVFQCQECWGLFSISLPDEYTLSAYNSVSIYNNGGFALEDEYTDVFEYYLATFSSTSNSTQPAHSTATQTETRTYDAFNRLIRVERPDMTSTYNYRADGLRRSKTVNGTITQHVWNGMHIVLERNASGGVVERIYRGLNGHLIRSHLHGFYLLNARGDVVQRTNTAGAVLHTYQYDAFGNELNPNPNNRNPFRFASEYFDSCIGEYYLRARSFNPRIGRFTQMDPHWGIGNMMFGDNPRRMNERQDPLGNNLYTMVPDQWAIMQAGNLYVYVMNNPVFWNDPSGRAGVGAIIAAAVTMAARALQTPAGQRAIYYGKRVVTQAGQTQAGQNVKQAGNMIVQGVNTAGGAINNLVKRGGTNAANSAPQVTTSAQQAAPATQNILHITSQIQNVNGLYHAPKHVVNQLGQIEARGVNFSQLQRTVTYVRHSTEGGFSQVVRYSDSAGVRFVIHEVTNNVGAVLHRDFDAVRIASGQIINALKR